MLFRSVCMLTRPLEEGVEKELKGMNLVGRRISEEGGSLVQEDRRRLRKMIVSEVLVDHEGHKSRVDFVHSERLCRVGFDFDDVLESPATKKRRRSVMIDQ